MPALGEVKWWHRVRQLMVMGLGATNLGKNKMECFSLKPTPICWWLNMSKQIGFCTFFFSFFLTTMMCMVGPMSNHLTDAWIDGDGILNVIVLALKPNKKPGASEGHHLKQPITHEKCLQVELPDFDSYLSSGQHPKCGPHSSTVLTFKWKFKWKLRRRPVI